jgi:hypothetical protein
MANEKMTMPKDNIKDATKIKKHGCTRNVTNNKCMNYYVRLVFIGFCCAPQ